MSFINNYKALRTILGALVFLKISHENIFLFDMGKIIKIQETIKIRIFN